MNPFQHDIYQQPQALRDLLSSYHEALEGFPPASQSIPTLLTGMGASFNAAQIAAFHLNHLGWAATAVEATDLLFYGEHYRQTCRQLVFVSQSGSSAEVAPLTANIAANATLLAVTNHPESLLAERADGSFPLLAGTEHAPVASKTYVNSLAALWLLVGHLVGRGDGSEAENLYRLIDRCEILLGDATTIVEQWLDRVGDSDHLLFVGHGPHAATARQSAMMINEWVKQPASGMSIGAFRHGPIEITRPNLGVVVFAAPGAAQASAWQLAAELEENGAQVIVVEAGQTRRVADKQSADEAVDEFLWPILDVIPAQLFTEALARHRGTDTTFQYISKVITRL